ncbi:hypothetical protein KFU94_48055 [Chloroflexi bacterium TSY]|nr:hypothetical protein [Chloroflexi bacterium TSY]
MGLSHSGVALVALVEWNDQSHVPAQCGETIADDIMSRIQSGSLDGQAEEFAPSIECGKTKDAVVAIAISHGDDQGQLTAMLEGIGSQFIASVPIDPTVAIAIQPQRAWGR